MKELILLRLQRLKGFFKSESRFKAFVYLSVIFIFFAGTYLFFYRVFSFLKTIEDIGEIISGKIISYSFFVFFFMLLFSNGITSLSTFYRSKEVEYLFSLPLFPMNIFLLKLFDNIFFSSWATMIGALPILFAYLNAYRKPFFIIPLIIPVLLFITIPAFLSITLLLILKKFNPRLSVKKLAFYLIIFSSIIIYFYIRTNPYSFRVPFTYDLNAINKFLDSLRFSNPYFPNEWFSNIISGLMRGDFKIIARYFSALFFLSIATYLTLFIISSIWYRITWLNDESQTLSPVIKTRFIISSPSHLLNLISKDVRIFIRSPSQWIQFLIFFILLILYIASLRNAPLYFKDPFWLTITALINTAFVGYINATLALRYVFPAMSLETPYLWLYRSSPLKPKTLYLSKIIFYIILTTILTVFVIYLSNIRLTNDFNITLFTILVGILISITIVIISGSFGVYFIEFNESNPAKIASGLGGLLTAIFSLLYIGLTLYLFFQPLSKYIKGILTGDNLNLFPIIMNSFLIFFIFTLILNIILVLSGIKRTKYVQK